MSKLIKKSLSIVIAITIALSQIITTGFAEVSAATTKNPNTGMTINVVKGESVTIDYSGWDKYTYDEYYNHDSCSQYDKSIVDVTIKPKKGTMTLKGKKVGETTMTLSNGAEEKCKYGPLNLFSGLKWVQSEKIDLKIVVNYEIVENGTVDLKVGEPTTVVFDAPAHPDDSKEHCSQPYIYDDSYFTFTIDMADAPSYDHRDPRTHMHRYTMVITPLKEGNKSLSIQFDDGYSVGAVTPKIYTWNMNIAPADLVFTFNPGSNAAAGQTSQEIKGQQNLTNSKIPVMQASAGYKFLGWTWEGQSTPVSSKELATKTFTRNTVFTAVYTELGTPITFFTFKKDASLGSGDALDFDGILNTERFYFDQSQMESWLVEAIQADGANANAYDDNDFYTFTENKSLASYGINVVDASGASAEARLEAEAKKILSEQFGEAPFDVNIKWNNISYEYESSKGTGGHCPIEAKVAHFHVNATYAIEPKLTFVLSGNAEKVNGTADFTGIVCEEQFAGIKATASADDFDITAPIYALKADGSVEITNLDEIKIKYNGEDYTKYVTIEVEDNSGVKDFTEVSVDFDLDGNNAIANLVGDTTLKAKFATADAKGTVSGNAPTVNVTDDSKTFIGWEFNGEILTNSEVEAYEFGENAVLKAKFVDSTKTFVVNWNKKAGGIDLGNGSVSVSADYIDGTYPAEYKNIAFADITNEFNAIKTAEDYTFIDFTFSDGFDAENVKENDTVTANFVPNKKEITFNLINDSLKGTVASEVKVDGIYDEDSDLYEAVAVLPTPVNNSGYLFSHWTYQDGEEVKTFDASENKMFSDGTDFTAVYTELGTPITFFTFKKDASLGSGDALDFDGILNTERFYFDQSQMESWLVEAIQADGANANAYDDNDFYTFTENKSLASYGINVVDASGASAEARLEAEAKKILSEQFGEAPFDVNIKWNNISYEYESSKGTGGHCPIEAKVAHFHVNATYAIEPKLTFVLSGNAEKVNGTADFTGIVCEEQFAGIKATASADDFDITAPIYALKADGSVEITNLDEIKIKYNGEDYTKYVTIEVEDNSGVKDFTEVSVDFDLDGNNAIANLVGDTTLKAKFATADAKGTVSGNAPTVNVTDDSKTFIGWEFNGEILTNSEVEAYEFGENAVLKAKFVDSTKTFVVNWNKKAGGIDLGNGSVSVSADYIDGTYPAEYKNIAFADITNEFNAIKTAEDYTFIDFTFSDGFDAENVKENDTVTANFVPNKKEITFNLINDSLKGTIVNKKATAIVNYNPETGEYDDAPFNTISINDPFDVVQTTTFAGWSTDGKTVIDANSTQTFKDGTNFIAVYIDDKSVTVTFEGVTETKTVTADYDLATKSFKGITKAQIEAVAPAVPEKEGNDGAWVINERYSSDKDIEISAQYDEQDKDVKFIFDTKGFATLDGDSEVVTSTKYFEKVAVTFPNVTVTDENKKFIGWKDSTGKTAVTGDEYGKDQTFTAVYQDKLTYEFIKIGGTTQKIAVYVEEGETTAPFSEIEKNFPDGFNDDEGFIGWTVDGENVENDEEYGEDDQFIADYSDKSVTVTFEGVTETKTVTADYDLATKSFKGITKAQIEAVAPAVPEKEGATPRSWTISDTYPSDKDIMISAIYVEDKKLTFVFVDGYTNEILSTVYKFVSYDVENDKFFALPASEISFPEPVNHSEDGYSFEYWEFFNREISPINAEEIENYENGGTFTAIYTDNNVNVDLFADGVEILADQDFTLNELVLKDTIGEGFEGVITLVDGKDYGFALTEDMTEAARKSISNNKFNGINGGIDVKWETLTLTDNGYRFDATYKKNSDLALTLTADNITTSDENPELTYKLEFNNQDLQNAYDNGELLVKDVVLKINENNIEFISDAKIIFNQKDISEIINVSYKNGEFTALNDVKITFNPVIPNAYLDGDSSVNLDFNPALEDGAKIEAIPEVKFEGENDYLFLGWAFNGLDKDYLTNEQLSDKEFDSDVDLNAVYALTFTFEANEGLILYNEDGYVDGDNKIIKKAIVNERGYASVEFPEYQLTDYRNVVSGWKLDNVLVEGNLILNKNATFVISCEKSEDELPTPPVRPVTPPDETDDRDDDIPTAPQPEDDDDDDTVIEDDEVPTAPQPEDDGDDEDADNGNNGDTVIEDDEVPTAPQPEDDGDDEDADNGNNGDTVIEDDEVPTAPQPEDDGDDEDDDNGNNGDTVIEDDDIPTSILNDENIDGNKWALITLILSVLTVLFAIISIFTRDRNGEKLLLKVRLILLLPAIASIIVLLITQSFSGKMSLFDIWTPAVAILFVLDIIFSLKARNVDNEEDGEQYNY